MKTRILPIRIIVVGKKSVGKTSVADVIWGHPTYKKMVSSPELENLNALKQQILKTTSKITTISQTDSTHALTKELDQLAKQAHEVRSQIECTYVADPTITPDPTTTIVQYPFFPFYEDTQKKISAIVQIADTPSDQLKEEKRINRFIQQANLIVCVLDGNYSANTINDEIEKYEKNFENLSFLSKRRLYVINKCDNYNEAKAKFSNSDYQDLIVIVSCTKEITNDLYAIMNKFITEIVEQQLSNIQSASPTKKQQATLNPIFNATANIATQQNPVTSSTPFPLPNLILPAASSAPIQSLSITIQSNTSTKEDKSDLDYKKPEYNTAASTVSESPSRSASSLSHPEIPSLLLPAASNLKIQPLTSMTQINKKNNVHPITANAEYRNIYQKMIVKTVLITFLISKKIQLQNQQKTWFHWLFFNTAKTNLKIAAINTALEEVKEKTTFNGVQATLGRLIGSSDYAAIRARRSINFFGYCSERSDTTLSLRNINQTYFNKSSFLIKKYNQKGPV